MGPGSASGIGLGARLGHDRSRHPSRTRATRDGAAVDRGGRAGPDRAAARRLARPAQPIRAPPPRAGRRDRPDHRRHALLLRQRRRRPRAAGARRGDHRRLRLQEQARRHPHPGDALDRARQPDQRRRWQGGLQLRLRSPVPRPRARIRSTASSRTRSTSCAPTRRARDPGLGVAARPRGPDRDAGHHGRRLRRLPQLPPRQPEDRLEGRRRARHPGDLGLAIRSAATSSPSNICWSTSSSPPVPASPSS